MRCVSSNRIAIRDDRRGGSGGDGGGSTMSPPSSSYFGAAGTLVLLVLCCPLARLSWLRNLLFREMYVCSLWGIDAYGRAAGCVSWYAGAGGENLFCHISSEVLFSASTLWSRSLLKLEGLWEIV